MVTTFKDSQYYQDKNVLLVDYLILQDSCMKSSLLESSFLETNLLESSKFRNEFEVKDYLSLFLNQTSSTMIKTYSRAISYQDRTSIFS